MDDILNVSFWTRVRKPTGIMSRGYLPRVCSGLFLAIGFIILTLSSAVAQTGTGDVTAPVLGTLSISPATVNTGASTATVTITANLTDDSSGILSTSWCPVFNTPTNGLLAADTCMSRTMGTPTNGTYVSTLTVPQGAAQGTYTMAAFDITDIAGNRRTVTASNLTAAGFPDSFNNGPPAIVPESPLAVELPLMAIGIMGVFALMRARRRHGKPKGA